MWGWLVPRRTLLSDPALASSRCPRVARRPASHDDETEACGTRSPSSQGHSAAVAPTQRQSQRSSPETNVRAQIITKNLIISMYSLPYMKQLNSDSLSSNDVIIRIVWTLKSQVNIIFSLSLKSAYHVLLLNCSRTKVYERKSKLNKCLCLAECCASLCAMTLNDTVP